MFSDFFPGVKATFIGIFSLAIIAIGFVLYQYSDGILPVSQETIAQLFEKQRNAIDANLRNKNDQITRRLDVLEKNAKDQARITNSQMQQLRQRIALLEQTSIDAPKIPDFSGDIANLESRLLALEKNPRGVIDTSAKAGVSQAFTEKLQNLEDRVLHLEQQVPSTVSNRGNGQAESPVSNAPQPLAKNSLPIDVSGLVKKPDSKRYLFTHAGGCLRVTIIDNSGRVKFGIADTERSIIKATSALRNRTREKGFKFEFPASDYLAFVRPEISENSTFRLRVSVC